MTGNRFLVTGLPRIRSAWFAALFTALGVDTCHEYGLRFGTLGALRSWLHGPKQKGWCDPSAACLHPEFAAAEFAGCPVVIIERDAEESRKSLERWSGLPLAGFNKLLERFISFKFITPQAVIVQYSDLDQYATVSRIVRHCCGIELPYHIWQAFDLLRIEQHMPKARAA